MSRCYFLKILQKKIKKGSRAEGPKNMLRLGAL